MKIVRKDKVTKNQIELLFNLVLKSLKIESGSSFIHIVENILRKVFHKHHLAFYSLPTGDSMNKSKIIIRHVFHTEEFKSEIDDTREKRIKQQIEKLIGEIYDKTYVDLYLPNMSFTAIYLGNSLGQGYVCIIYEENEIGLSHQGCSLIREYTSNILGIISSKRKEDLEDLIYLDDVTGLFNQRKLHKDLQKKVCDCEKNEEKFIILFMDVDHFKQVNDNYGHIVGTKILKNIGNIIKNELRDDDFTYRYGGDEFVAILGNADIISGAMVAQRILEKIKMTKFEALKSDVLHHLLRKKNHFLDKDKKTFHLSVSIGLAVYPEDASTYHDILMIADSMMYHAKGTGRGRVCATSQLIEKDEYANNRSK